MESSWDPRTWGTTEDPVHKSDLYSIGSPYGCLEAFLLGKNRRKRREPEEYVSGKAAMGNAIHAAIAYALQGYSDLAIPTGEGSALFDEMFARECGNLPVRWHGKTDGEEMSINAGYMIAGACRDIRRYVGRPLAVEHGFEFARDGIVFGGMIDLIAVDGRGDAHIVDWKTGLELPDEVGLHHGPEAAMYALAFGHGEFVDPSLFPDDVRALSPRDAVIAAFAKGKYLATWRPNLAAIGRVHIWHVHLRDYIPQKRKSKRTITREWEAQVRGVDVGAAIEVQAGEPRGIAWHRVRTEAPDALLADRDPWDFVQGTVRPLVDLVRAGHTIRIPSELCGRCPYRPDCLAPQGSAALAPMPAHVVDYISP